MERIANVDIELLRACITRDTYNTYKDIVKTYMITEVSWGLLGDIGEYYSSNESTKTIEEASFKSWFRITRYPSWKIEKHAMYDKILSSIFTTTTVDKSVTDLLLRQRIEASISESLKQGNIKEVREYIDDLDNVGKTVTDDIKFDSDNIDEILQDHLRYGGLSWRLEDLNKAAGPITKGDLVVVGKRPETGGTSFILSEVTHMITQLPKDARILVINNEEAAIKLLSRSICVALNIDVPTLNGDASKYINEYKKYLDGRRIDIHCDSGITTTKIEKMAKANNYSLICLNVLEKIQAPFLPRGLEDYQRLEKLGLWARSLALRYSPVIAIVQADASAEGVPYPDQSMLYKSKTGLQAEADLLIMIGRTEEDETTRYIRLAKNKLPGNAGTDPKLRHLKSEVDFDILTGRYTSRAWKK